MPLTTWTSVTGIDLITLFDAYTILMATVDDTPIALTVAEQTLIGRITGGTIASLTVAQIKTLLGVAAASGIASLDAASLVVQNPANATATPTALKIPIADGSALLNGWVTLAGLGGVAKILFDAQTILVAVLDDTPVALTVGEQTLVGRITGGNIAALTPAQVITLLALPQFAKAMVIIDLSGGAVSNVVLLHTSRACTLLKAIILYTEASSADAGVTITIGKETNSAYYYTGASEVSQAQWYEKDVTLLATDIAAGDTLICGTAGGKVGTGEVLICIEYKIN